MENYTKYKLKGYGELADLLEGKDNLFVIACNKCFKEFETLDEPDCDAFMRLAEGLDKHITGTARVDFLCNKTKAEKGLKDMIPDGFTAKMAAVGSGNMNFAAILDTLKHNGVTEYALVEQDDCYGASPFDCLKSSLDYVNHVLGGT